MKHGESICNRYDMIGYWSSTCCTSKHFVDLYQISLKDKHVETYSLKNAFVETDIEVNVALIERKPPTHVEVKTLEVFDSFENTDGKEQKESLDW